MTIEAAITNLQGKWMSLAGIKSAPNVPPEGVGAFPFAVSYERSGTFDIQSAGFGFDLATIYSELHVSRQLLPVSITTATNFRDNFLKLLIGDPTLSESVSNVRQIRRTFGRLEWGGIETIGYRFEVDVKLLIST
jgi:hypothetical protein